MIEHDQALREHGALASGRGRAHTTKEGDICDDDGRAERGVGVRRRSQGERAAWRFAGTHSGVDYTILNGEGVSFIQMQRTADGALDNNIGCRLKRVFVERISKPVWLGQVQ